MAALAGNQTELGKVLGVSQQTVSKKLLGECAIFVSDLETLAKRHRVKMTYFFEVVPDDVRVGNDHDIYGAHRTST